ncbi:MAG: BrnT family toxin [Lachnospiraceae bacterium]|nr:BrnT family toxin [Lachnospiraceae bacterium]
MKFEWDEEKERLNIEKHGIDFRTAVQVFHDENRIEYFDKIHSIGEDRYITIGMIGERMIIITLVYTERVDVIRVISARVATKKERRFYEDGIL